MKKLIATVAILFTSPAFAVVDSNTGSVPDGDRLSLTANPNTAATKAATSLKQSTTFKVIDISCANCETRVKAAVRSVAGVRAVSTNAQTGEVVYTSDGANQVDENAVISAIEGAGFSVTR